MIENTIVQSAGALQALGSSLRKLEAWWLRELHALFPRLGWATSDKQSSLVVTSASGTVKCRLNGDAREYTSEYHAASFNDAALDQWLAELGMSRERTRVGLALDQSLFFVRDLTLPRAALRALPQILEQDLVRRTPFDPARVWHGGVECNSHAGTSSEVIDVRHWIVRRDRVEAAVGELGLPESSVDFLAVMGESDDPLASISLRRVAPAEPSWIRRAVQLLAAFAIVVMTVGLGLISGVQSRVANGIDEQLVEARQSMGLANSSGLSRLIMQKSETSVAEIWDELSRTLPDNTYLSDMRIADGKVLLSGFSADAPRLVKLIGQSRLFGQVTLVGAITPNAGDGKDQFKITITVRRGRTARSDASDQKAGL